MKTLISLIVTVIIFFAAANTSHSANKVKMETVKIKCTKMHCEGCKATIVEAVQQMDGISKIEVDLKTKMITVKFDNKKTSRGAVSAKILEAGYENEIVN